MRVNKVQQKEGAKQTSVLLLIVVGFVMPVGPLIRFSLIEQNVPTTIYGRETEMVSERIRSSGQLHK